MATLLLKSDKNPLFEKRKNAQKVPFLSTFLAVSQRILRDVPKQAHIRIALIITHILVITFAVFRRKAKTLHKSDKIPLFKK